jgi:hypothetical protein
MSFKVAILGNPRSTGETFWGSFTYGIQVYDLAAEQICSILQSPDHSNGGQGSNKSFPSLALSAACFGYSGDSSNYWHFALI